jgi:UDP-N-acetyl-D-glucosamine dehydrogenase
MLVDALRPRPSQAFDPGPGLGGHCIPINPFYLSWKSKQFVRTRFIKLAGEVNVNMPYYVIEPTAAVLNRRKKATNAMLTTCGSSLR